MSTQQQDQHRNAGATEIQQLNSFRCQRLVPNVHQYTPRLLWSYKTDNVRSTASSETPLTNTATMHDFCEDYLEITTDTIVPCSGPKSLTVHWYSIVIFTFSAPLELYAWTLLFPLNPGLGGMIFVASDLILHEQTQSNQVCCFQILNAVFPKDLFSVYLDKPMTKD